MTAVLPLCLLLAAAHPAGDPPPCIDTIVTVAAPPCMDTLRLTGELLPSGRFLLRARRLSGGARAAAPRESRWLVEHPVFQAFAADLDRDGVPELCLGVVKPVRGDRTARRRLQVFAVRDGTIRPAWLGSRMGMPLLEAAAPAGGGLLTIEREQEASRYAVGRWGWTRFGPAFLRYELRGAALDDCRDCIASLR